jgi:hypothetical protein
MHEKGVWFTPARSVNGTQCVETMITDDAVHVRNSKHPDAGTVTFTHAEWRAFVESVHTTDDYDLPA